MAIYCDGSPNAIKVACSVKARTINNNVIDFGEINASLNKQGIYQKLPISNSPTTNKKDEFIITVEWTVMTLR